MKCTEVMTSSAVVVLSRDELVLLNNALNEVCYGVDIPAFETRIGASHQEAEALLKQIASALMTMNAQ